MMEINGLRHINEEAARSFEQINIWQKEQEAKEEKLKFLIREKNQKERKINEMNFDNR